MVAEEQGDPARRRLRGNRLGHAARRGLRQAEGFLVVAGAACAHIDDLRVAPQFLEGLTVEQCPRLVALDFDGLHLCATGNAGGKGRRAESLGQRHRREQADQREQHP